MKRVAQATRSLSEYLISHRDHTSCEFVQVVQLQGGFVGLRERTYRVQKFRISNFEKFYEIHHQGDTFSKKAQGFRPVVQRTSEAVKISLSSLVKASVNLSITISSFTKPSACSPSRSGVSCSTTHLYHPSTSFVHQRQSSISLWSNGQLSLFTLPLIFSSSSKLLSFTLRLTFGEKHS